MPKVFATARCARPWFGWTRTTWPTALRGNQIQAPRAVDATSSPELHLLDGVELPRRRRDAVPRTAAPRWRAWRFTPVSPQ